MAALRRGQRTAAGKTGARAGYHGPAAQAIALTGTAAERGKSRWDTSSWDSYGERTHGGSPFLDGVGAGGGREAAGAYAMASSLLPPPARERGQRRCVQKCWKGKKRGATRRLPPVLDGRQKGPITDRCGRTSACRYWYGLSHFSQKAICASSLRGRGLGDWSG